jgi:hypothetical protein
VATDNAISDTTAVLSAVQTLTATGLSSTAFEHWCNKNKTDQTYANLMIHFNQANINRQHTKTIAKAGYSAATATNTATKKEN